MKALSTALQSMAAIEKVMTYTPAKDLPAVKAWFKATFLAEPEDLPTYEDRP